MGSGSFLQKKNQKTFGLGIVAVATPTPMA
jgi:hypothetical protein